MGVSLLTIVMSLLAYGALAVFIVGFFSRVVKYAKTPSPLKIPTTPAPLTPIGVIGRMFLDVVFFRSLFKGNKWTWIGGIIFHYSFLLVILRHLRYFFYPEPAWVMDVQAIGIYAGFVLPLAVLYLTMRRTTVDRTMFVSSLADYFILALVFCIAGTGIIMNYYDRPFIVDIKGFVYGLVMFPITFKLSVLNNFPLDPVFIVHFLLVLTLLVYFPFSKLMHMGGLFFSPTRFMTDNPREKRHVNPWSPNLSS